MTLLTMKYDFNTGRVKIATQNGIEVCDSDTVNSTMWQRHQTIIEIIIIHIAIVANRFASHRIGFVCLSRKYNKYTKSVSFIQWDAFRRFSFACLFVCSVVQIIYAGCVLFIRNTRAKNRSNSILFHAFSFLYSSLFVDGKMYCDFPLFGRTKYFDYCRSTIRFFVQSLGWSLSLSLYPLYLYLIVFA